MDISQEIAGLSHLSKICCCEFRHIVVGGTRISSAVLPEAIVTWTPPRHLTWIVTRIDYRSIPVAQDAEVGPGDWRSFDIDAECFGTSYWQVSGSKVTPIANYFLLLNHDCLFLFQGGSKVELMLDRTRWYDEARSYPTNMRVVTHIHGFLAPQSASDKLSQHVTQIVDVSTVDPDDGGGDMS